MSGIWPVYTAAPHRVLFLPGFIQGLLAMAWWLFDLNSRLAGGDGLVAAGLPAPLLHGWMMLYGFLPFFVFGFLFTALPNWVSGPAIGRSAYLLSTAGLSAGVLLLYFGFTGLGLLLHLLGWSLAMQALLTSLMAGKDRDKRHAWAAWAALAWIALGETMLLAGLMFGQWHWLQAGLDLGLWGGLLPLFLTVCHRMIPWFTSRVVVNYVIIRPYSLLWALWAGCLLHFGLNMIDTAALTWLVDFALAGMVFWLAAHWGFKRAFQARLLAVLHIAFLWAGAAFVLYGLDSLARFLELPWSAGWAPLHAVGIGFFGAMLIGMASRVSLGHSGRPLQADVATWRLFWLLQVAALLRMLPDLAAGMLPATLPATLTNAAGVLWLGVFLVWSWKYAPMTWRPRVDGKPG